MGNLKTLNLKMNAKLKVFLKCKHTDYHKASSQTHINNPNRSETLHLGLTGKDLMFHCTALFSGTHLALPVLLLNLGESASLGTGTRMATLLAVERLLN